MLPTFPPKLKEGVGIVWKWLNSVNKLTLIISYLYKYSGRNNLLRACIQIVSINNNS